MDDTIMNIAYWIAQVISIMIWITSLFTVYIDPTAIQYTIVFFMAFAKAVMDASDLISGRSVPLFYHDSVEDAIDTSYRDYFRVFLLFIPEDKLLDRMRTVIQRDCGEHLYTGVYATGMLGDDSYSVKRRFELYDNRE
jgi:hypothetical protein